jgi:hypothetical protein
MGKSPVNRLFFALALLAAMTIIILPVSAINGTIDIAYRGYGGNYLGDTIIFDGHNSFSNITLLKITGPALPAEGLPVYDLNGQPGTGNTVVVKEDGSWRFVWYTSSIKGLEKLQTARYYITAFDLTYPDKSSTTSLMLKKPEFYVDISPSTAGPGDYIQLTGSSEKDSNTVRFDIADADGKILHSYDSTISASGYFHKGFHVDMPPGIYTITMTSPSTKYVYRNYLTVLDAAALAQINANATAAAQRPGTVQTIPVSSLITPSPSGTGSLSVTSTPLGATVFIDSVMAGTTPFDQNVIAAGDHYVEVKAPGYAPYTTQVSIKTGETMKIDAALVKTPGTPLSLFTIILGLLAALTLVHTGTKRS